MLTFPEYKSFYESKGYFPDGSYVRPKGYNEAQLKSKFQKYERSQNRKKMKTLGKGSSQDHKWIDTKKELWETKGTDCALCSVLNDEEFQTLISNDIFNLKTIDPAHVLGKGAFPKSYYKVKNLVPLNRYSHSMLDSGHHPLTGKVISKKEKIEWWDRILIQYGLNYQDMLDWYTKL